MIMRETGKGTEENFILQIDKKKDALKARIIKRNKKYEPLQPNEIEIRLQR